MKKNTYLPKVPPHNTIMEEFQNSIKITKHAKCNKIDEKLRKNQLYKQMYKIWMWREKHIQSMAKISFNYKNK